MVYKVQWVQRYLLTCSGLTQGPSVTEYRQLGCCKPQKDPDAWRYGCHMAATWLARSRSLPRVRHAVSPDAALCGSAARAKEIVVLREMGA